MVEGGPVAPRFIVTVYLTTGDEMQPFGRTRDLSITGAFVETEARPDIGSVQELAIVWGDDTLFCTARVIRHTADGIGIAFVEPDAGLLRAVQEITDTAPVRERAI